MCEKLLDETKKMIKSIVIPHPNGVNLKTLCEEYEEFEGKPLPYKELGFNTLTAFLRSISDVIRMFGNPSDGQTVILYPVLDSSTAHIQKMVAEQCKKKPPKRKSPRNPHRLYPFSHRNNYPNSYVNQTLNRKSYKNPPLFSHSLNANVSRILNSNQLSTYQLGRTIKQQTPQSNQCTYRSKQTSNLWDFRVTRDLSNQSSNRTECKKLKSSSNPSLNTITRPSAQPLSGHKIQLRSQSPFVDSTVKENLKLMMSSSDMEDGLMLFNFEPRYKYQFKESLDWKKFGFTSLVDCLKSMPQLVTLIPTGTNTYKLMPNKSNSTHSNSNSNTSHENRNIKLNSTQCPTTSTILTNGHSMAIITTTATSTTVTFVTTSSTAITTTSITTQNNMTSNSLKPRPPPVLSEKSSNPSTRTIASTPDIDMSPFAIRNFRIILNEFKDGIPYLQFIKEYEKRFGVFESRVWGFGSAMELFYTLDTVFAIDIPKNATNSDPILHDARYKSFERSKPDRRIADSTTSRQFSNIPDVTLARIMKLIQTNMPLGLPLRYFFDEYKLNYGAINLSQIPMTDTNHLFDILRCHLPIELKVVDGNDRVFIKSQNLVDQWIIDCCRQQRYIVPEIMVDVPPNVALPGDLFTPSELPPDVEVGNVEYTPVLISSANSPSELFIQFKAEHEALEQLMIDLEFYDCADEDQWTVPNQFHCIGLPVAVRYSGDGYWHRARITEILNDRNICVDFVDYGGSMICDLKSLRLLKKEFLALKEQAFKVSLYGIKPILGDDWTSLARDEILKFSEPDYYIACAFIEEINNSYFVCLCDTNSDTDVFIHNVLVDHKHAVFEDGLLDQSREFNESDEQIIANASNILNSNQLDVYELNRSFIQQTTQSNTFSNEPNIWHFEVTRDLSNQSSNEKESKKLKSSSNPSLNTITRPSAQPLSGHEVQLRSQSPFVDSTVKENLKLMMSSSDMEDGLMLFNFEPRYKYQFKESLDWKKFGFTSLVDCLKSMPQLVTLIPTGINTYKLMPNKSNSTHSNSNSNTSHENRNIKLNSTQCPTASTVLTNGHSMAIITTTAPLVKWPTTSTTTSTSTQNNMIVNCSRPTPSPTLSDDLSNSSSPTSSPTSDFDINPVAIRNFRSILNEFKDGIPSLQFIEEYEKKFGVIFQSNIWGFSSAMELFYSLSTVFAIEIPKNTRNSDPILHDARYKSFERPKPDHSNPDSTIARHFLDIPDITVARIMKLIKNYMPSGLPLPYFLNDFKQNYGDINLSQMRINDTNHLFNILKSFLPIEVKIVDGNNRVFLKSLNLVDEWIINCCRQQRYIVPKIMVDVPPNVALPGDLFTPSELPPDVEIGSGEYTPVLISSANSPSEVFIQFKEEHEALEQLMRDLDFYDYADEDQWTVPKQFHCVGLPVAVRYSGDRYWHRASITKILNDRNISVVFVDYGGSMICDLKSLRLLKKEFLMLRAQAFKVSLYGIKPILGQTDGWTAVARDKILRFSKPDYYIACTFIEKINNSYFVCLCDTNSDTDVFIHNVLVDHKHAVFEDGLLDQSEELNESDEQNISIYGRNEELFGSSLTKGSNDSLQEETNCDFVKRTVTMNRLQEKVKQMIITLNQ